MKKSILFLSTCCAMALAACSENKDYYNEEVANDAAGIVTPDLSNMASLESFQVTASDIVPGMVTIVKCNGQLIAATQEPITIDVPKSTGASTRAASDVTVENITLEAFMQGYLGDEEGEFILPYWKLWQVVCFEDTKALDFDYNDLVLHVKTQRSGNKLSVGVQCVAMGNTKQISLGLQIMQKDVQGNYSQTFDNKIVIEDCKKTFFPNANPTEFVNTVVDKQDSDRANHCVKNFTTVYNEVAPGNETDYVVLYYIKTEDGQTIYAIPSKYGFFPDMIATGSLSDKGWPLGFTVADTGIRFFFNTDAPASVRGDGLTTLPCGLDWFDYPVEQKNICDVYPGFKNWVTGDDGNGVFMDYGGKDYIIDYDAGKTAADNNEHYMFNVESFATIPHTYPAIENGLYALTEKQGTIKK